ncbi:hypothetical protein [Nocardia sp. IFM 10818]
MGGNWLLGVAFGGAGAAAAGLDLAVRHVKPIGLPGAGEIPPEPEAVVWVLRAALAAAGVGRGAEAPAGLVLACPDEWLAVHAGMLAQAAEVVGYPANLVRLIPISAAVAHDTADRKPPRARRASRFWVPGVALAIVIASGATAVIAATRGDNTASAAAASTTPQPTTLRPAIVFSPATGGGDPAQPGITKPDLPLEASPPRETSEPPPIITPPAPTTTALPAPTITAPPAPPAPRPVEPDPTNPAPPEQPAPPTDLREATIRGFCQGILNQMDNFPGGLPAMRAQMPPPLFSSPADWSEAFDRAAAGSCA